MIRIIPSRGAGIVLDRLESRGFEAYAVGGCVRDSLLGRVPNDWDVTTNALPEQTLSCFSDFRTVETGRKHGTVTVIVEGEPIEITTYRTDGIYEDNRHPVQVSFSTRLADDLSRRDFTVNAMAYHPLRGLVDPFGGQKDLQNGVLRTVGEATARFHEDGLRILRAIRFASVLDFSIEKETERSIRSCRSLLDHIARERVREEFCKLLCGNGAVRILRAYPEVIGQFLPEITPCVGFPQNTKYHAYDVFEHTLRALSLANSDLNTRLCILLHDIAKPHCLTQDELGDHFKGHGEAGAKMAEEILSRLKFDNATKNEVVTLVEIHDRPLSSDVKSVRKLLAKYGEPTLFRLIELQRCDRLAHAKGYDAPPQDLLRIPSVIEQIKAQNDCLSLATLAVKGDDLIAAGFPKGKIIGETLQKLLNGVMEGNLPNEKNALLEEAKKEGVQKLR